MLHTFLATERLEYFGIHAITASKVVETIRLHKGKNAERPSVIGEIADERLKTAVFVVGEHALAVGDEIFQLGEGRAELVDIVVTHEERTTFVLVGFADAVKCRLELGAHPLCLLNLSGEFLFPRKHVGVLVLRIGLVEGKLLGVYVFSVVHGHGNTCGLLLKHDDVVVQLVTELCLLLIGQFAPLGVGVRVTLFVDNTWHVVHASTARHTFFAARSTEEDCVESLAVVFHSRLARGVDGNTLVGAIGEDNVGKRVAAHESALPVGIGEPRVIVSLHGIVLAVFAETLCFAHSLFPSIGHLLHFGIALGTDCADFRKVCP